jgi:hypothetical protein
VAQGLSVQQGHIFKIRLSRCGQTAFACEPTIPLTDYSLYGILYLWAWDVEFTSRFETWWNSLSEDEQIEISAKVELLQERGPTLPRPHADVISTSRHANMKELRGHVEGRHLRVLYAFDPRRKALALTRRRQDGRSQVVRKVRADC